MSQENLQAELIVLYEETMQKAKKFHKKTYQSDIEDLQTCHKELLENIQRTIEESEENLEETASYIPMYVAAQLKAISSKRKKELAVIDYNMSMVSFFVPVMGEIPSTKTKMFTEKMVEIWNREMPENKIGHSTVAAIEGGFKKGLFCYITTAVCRSLEKPDDCYELNLLRDYRDHYLMRTEGGPDIVKAYYNIAPTIVKRIDREENASEIYKGIWEDYLNPCVHLIEEEKKEECRELYSDMVRSLEKKYLYS